MKKRFMQVAELFNDTMGSATSRTEQERIMTLATKLSALFADEIDTVNFMSVCLEGTKTINRQHVVHVPH